MPNHWRVIDRIFNAGLIRFPRGGAARTFVAAMVLAPLAGAAGDALPEPAGEVILTVSGNVAGGNGEADGKSVARFDRAMLERLGMHRIEATTAFLDGVTVFEGPLVRDVLAAAGADGETAHALALDGYTADVPVALFEEWDAILALDMDGVALPEEYAPIWIAWPIDDDPELAAGLTDDYWVWALTSLDLR